MPLLLVAVQLSELLWVALNLLLVVIVGFNLANITFFSATLRGPEELLAGHPTAVVLVVFAQIVATLILVGILARPRERPAQA